MEITTGPLGQGLGQRRRDGHGRPARARPARSRRGRGQVDLRPPDLRAGLRRRHRGGRHFRGVLARRHPATGQPHRDLRPQPHLHRGRHQHRPERGHRRALRGVRLARAEHRLDQRRHPVRGGRPGARWRRSRRPARSPTGPASSACARSSAGRRPTSRTPARPTAALWAPTRWPPPRRCSASTPTRPSRCPTRSSPTPATLLDRGAAGPGGVAEAPSTSGRAATPTPRRSTTGWSRTS